MTAAAKASLAAYDPVRDDLAQQCIPAGMPSMLDQPYPIEFIDEGDRIIVVVGVADAGVPLTRDAVVTERYTISADGRRMDWAVTTVDPAVLTSPASLSGWAVWAPSIEIKPLECAVE